MTVPWFELLERLSELLSVTCCNGRQVLSFSSAMVVILQHCHSWNIHNLRLTRETPTILTTTKRNVFFFFICSNSGIFVFKLWKRRSNRGFYVNKSCRIFDHMNVISIRAQMSSTLISGYKQFSCKNSTNSKNHLMRQTQLLTSGVLKWWAVE